MPEMTATGKLEPKTKRLFNNSKKIILHHLDSLQFAYHHNGLLRMPYPSISHFSSQGTPDGPHFCFNLEPSKCNDLVQVRWELGQSQHVDCLRPKLGNVPVVLCTLAHLGAKTIACDLFKSCHFCSRTLEEPLLNLSVRGSGFFFFI